MSGLILINSNSARPFAAMFGESIRIIHYAEGTDTLNPNNSAKRPDELGLALYKLSEELKKKNLSLKYADAIAVNIGPGSFTSIRVGLSLAKGLAMATNKKIIEITGFE